MAPLLSRIIYAFFYLTAAKESRFNAVLALYNKNFGKQDRLWVVTGKFHFDM